MAFGQNAGPAATGRQVKELLELLQNAGHADFRDARGPLGLNQRQAGGRFTAGEAAELIAQLQTAEHEAGLEGGAAEVAPKPAATAGEKKPAAAAAGVEMKPVGEMTAQEIAIRTASTKSLVLEVRRRGWAVTKSK